jgi:serine/threonine protein phosphatase PrpC
MELLRGGAEATQRDAKPKKLPSPTTDLSQNIDIVNLLGAFPVSVCSIRGYRSYMEDEFCTALDFCAVFDGHGGAKVSRYLRQNLYAEVQAALPAVLAGIAVPEKDINDIVLAVGTERGKLQKSYSVEDQIRNRNPDKEINDQESLANASKTTASTSASSSTSSGGLLQAPTVEDYETSLRRALEKVDREVQQIRHWSYQGSTVVAAWVHETKGNDGIDANKKCPPPPRRTLIVANIGDSRAVLCRNESAFDLTRDHKPNDPIERKRIEAAGGYVKWHGHVDILGDPIPGTGVYRVNGIISLSRAIGDRTERPVVTAEPDISVLPLQDETDDFIVLATDGLWDVMSSSDVVSFVHALMNSEEGDSIAAMLVEEALRRGSDDNITVIIVWLHEAHNSSIAGVGLS